MHILLAIAGDGRLEWSSVMMWSNYVGSPDWGGWTGSDSRSKRRINISEGAALVC